MPKQFDGYPGKISEQAIAILDFGLGYRKSRTAITNYLAKR